MEKYERIELLTEAQQKLNECINLIKTALKGTSDECYADAYILGHLRNWVDAGGYDKGIQQYIESVSDEDEDEDY